MDPTFGPIVEELDFSKDFQNKFWDFDVNILADVLSGLGVEDEKSSNYSSDEEGIVSVRSVRSGLLNVERPMLVQSPSQNSMGLTASCASLASSRSSGSISSSWAGSGKTITSSNKNNMNLNYPAPPPPLQPHQIPSINRSASENIPRNGKVQQPMRAYSEQLRFQDRPRPPVPIQTASMKYKSYEPNPTSIDPRTPPLVDECHDFFSQGPLESDLFNIPEPPRPEIQRNEISGTRTQKQPRTNENENQLTCLLAYYLQSPIANPYEGSVPVERLQNLMRSRHPELYHSVVGSRHNAWRRFLERHPDVFHLFSPESGKWRMALACNNNWQQGDRRERAALAAKKHHLIDCILHFLRTQPSHQCKVDDFMKAYPNLPPNLQHPNVQYPLPARGDLVRFVRSNPFFFRYDPVSLSIQLSQRAGITFMLMGSNQKLC